MHLSVRLVRGELADFDGDALVNAANSLLWMGSGIAGSIKRRGGLEIETEAVAQGPIPHGEAIVTAAGSLKVKKVIHAAGMSAGGEVNVRSIEQATLNALRRADEHGLERIAFSAIGNGGAGFPTDQIADIMLRVFRHYKPYKVREVTVVLYDDRALAIFEEAALQHFPKKGLVLAR